MSARLTPAALTFRADGALVSTAYGDIYHSAAGALAQADYVFARGNRLPERWRTRRVFTIVEIGFGAGCNFLSTWARWRDDADRCERLHFVSIEKHPFTREDLRTATAHIAVHPEIGLLAQRLVDAWPTLVPGLHRLEFEEGRVTLTLVLGDALEYLPRLVLRADAFYLDGFAPARNPDVWSLGVFRSLARLADERATFATYSCAGVVKRALEAAGFTYQKIAGFGGKRTMLVGEFAPRWQVRRHEPPRPLAVTERAAIVIGAGLAGCAMVERLAMRGWSVTLIERQSALACEASGNPAGVFHPLLARDDNFAARLARNGFLYGLRRWQALERAGHIFERSMRGLVQLASSADEMQRMCAAVDALGASADFVSWMSSKKAQAFLQMPVIHGGYFFPEGGALNPAALATAQCAIAGARLKRVVGVEAVRLERDGTQWRVLDRHGAVIGCAPVVIVANANQAAKLANLHHAPTGSVRGQITLLPAGGPAFIQVPLIGDGYALPLVSGALLIGATYEPDDIDPAIRAQGQRENLARFARLLPSCSAAAIPADMAPMLGGRVAFRCVASDRLPLVGALADESEASRCAASLCGAQPRDLPRAPGLYGAFGYGSRGLVWAALSAELIAAQIEGEPWPLERDLAEAIDPARFMMRELRQGGFG